MSPPPPITEETLSIFDLDFYTSSLLPPPPTPAIAQVLLLHGYGDHHRRYDPLRQHLASLGLASHGIDFRGQGRTTGPRGYVSRWTQYLDDVDLFLHSGTFDPHLPTFLLAHSHGALVAIHAALSEKLPLNTRGLILSAPYLAPAFHIPTWKRSLASLATHLAPKLTIPSGIGVIPMTRDPQMEADTNADPLIARCATPRWYITSRKAQSYALTHAPKLQLPLLLLLGTADGVANPDTMRSFFSSAGSKDKTKLEYPGLHHELLREVERNTIYHDISDWILSHSQHPAPYTPST